jgi:hypothetical protein
MSVLAQRFSDGAELAQRDGRERPETLQGGRAMMRAVFGKVEASGPWTAHIQAMDQAVAENAPGESVRAWRQAYSAALSHPGWLGLLTVAAASLRLGVFPGLARGAVARARETYWIAFFRARQQHSLNGVLHAAEAFGMLGDRATVEQCVRVAEGLASRTGDVEEVNRVRRLATRLAEQALSEERTGAI